ncbi:small subunit ribosomal protein S4 [Methanophagales archaeon]|jgi:small subunit ribosomal protein S4|nr:small subunit ribosomal protein S4 [Methanophagales archaeon]
MGHPRKRKKTYEKPRRPWEAKRIKDEKELTDTYGLKNKKEIWKAASFIKKCRREIRVIMAEIAGAKPTEHMIRKKEAILGSLKRKGILKQGEAAIDLDEVLSLSVEDVLERRLQTRVYKKELANTIKHARQLIVHGHIAVDGRRVTIPSYIIREDEEGKIGYYGKSE